MARKRKQQPIPAKLANDYANAQFLMRSLQRRYLRRGFIDGYLAGLKAARKGRK